MIGVYSYSRSGTFYLAAVLNRNFASGAPVARFAGHEVHSRAIDPDRAVYIVRNPVDCLYSCWRCWYAPNGESLDEYARRAIRRWKAHVEPWCAAAYWVRYEDILADMPGALAPLGERFGLRPIGEWRDYERPIGFRPGEAAQRTQAPRDGGRYLHYFTPDTLDAFHATLGDRFAEYDIAGLAHQRRHLCPSCA